MSENSPMMTDLSNQLRPKTLNEFIGQTHIIGEDKDLYKLIQKKEINCPWNYLFLTFF